MFDFILVPAYDLLGGLTHLTGATAAIVLFTVAVRTLLLPLAIRQARIQRTLARLAPEIKRLRTRFARNPERLQREVNKVYAREGTSQFAGLGPALAQAPFFMIAYRLFTAVTIAGQSNLLLAQGALGVPLGEHFGAVIAGTGLFSPPAAVFLGLFVLLAVVAWVASRAVAEDAPMRGLMRLLPFGTVLFAAFLPLAAGVYLLVSTTWTTVERRILFKPA